MFRACSETMSLAASPRIATNDAACSSHGRSPFNTHKRAFAQKQLVSGMALREDVSAFAAANDFPANPGNTLLFFRCLKTPVLFFLGGAKVEMNPTQAPNKERHFHPRA